MTPPNHDSEKLFASGTLTTGANYWASHAGIFMWRDWRPEVVEADFARLAGLGIKVLRLFPLWPDFQPISLLRKQQGHLGDYRHGEIALGAEGADVGEDGVSREMLRRLGVVADLAHQHGIGLVVAIVTGWMSGRLFVPPALEGRNPITDATSLQWQIRLARAIVEGYRHHPAIRAWDLGNECNCLGEASREEAWLWTASLANAIRAADPTRKVISGMHSLKVDPREAWSIRDQGELTDILTTHPYSLFTPYCDQEPLNTMRPLLHAAAETTLYADLSGKPAIVEEFGTLGPMVCGDEAAAAMARVRIFDTWTHDARAAVWWCAFDQSHLECAPYDWIPLERELGLLRGDGSAKPVAKAFKEAEAAIASLPKLNPRRIDAVCLLTEGQDQWGVAYSAFVLAKQAGFDLRFHYCDRAIPPAEFYILPSVNGLTPMRKSIEKQLWERVAEGATLYLSLDDTMLGDYVANAGVSISTRARRAEPCRVSLGNVEFQLDAPVSYWFRLSPAAEVLAFEADGRPVFFKTMYGKGEVYSLLAPLERHIASQAGAFEPEGALPYWHLYAAAAKSIIDRRLVRKSSPRVGITEHLNDDGSTTVVMVNYSDGPIREALRLKEGHLLGKVLLGSAPEQKEDRWMMTLPAATAAVWKVDPCSSQ